MPWFAVMGLPLALAIGCSGRPASYATPGASLSAAAQTDSGFTIRQLATGVYASIRNEPLGLINESNSLFIIGDSSVVVVDAQSSSARTAETLVALRKLTDKPVSALINTHWHDDHVVGNEVYQLAFPGLRIIGHASNAEDMRTMGVRFRKGGVAERQGTMDYLLGLVSKKESFLGGPIDAEESRSHQLAAWLTEDYSNADTAFMPLEPTETVTDRLVLHQGSRRIEIRHLGRGHTRGDLIVHLPREGIVAAGDLLMWPIQFVGSTSFPLDFADTEDRLRALRPEFVVPGHGPVLGKEDASAHAAMIVRLLRAVSAQTAAAKQRGESLEQARKSVDLSEFRQSMAGASRIRQVLFDYYVSGSAVARAYELAP